MSFYLLVDLGSTYAKFSLVDLSKKDIVLTTTEKTTPDDITSGFYSGINRLKKEIPFEISKENLLISSSAYGGLKMIAIGLIEELTTEAAKRACLGSGAKVDLVFSNKLTNDEIKRIEDYKPDIILLAGGIDGGNSEVVIHNAEKLSLSNITAPIIFAGNKDAKDEVSTFLTSTNKHFYTCENVMPKLNKLNIDDTKKTIQQIFINEIIKAKGIEKLKTLTAYDIYPTPSAVLKAGTLLSDGTKNTSGLGELMIADIGGATTDIYSMANGLPKGISTVVTGIEEPFNKRTVEGDLGMRLSALNVLPFLSEFEATNDLKKALEFRTNHPDFIPKDKKDFEVDLLIAKGLLNQATKRHVGTIKPIYTPMGMTYHQIGKDLSDIKVIVGTGGVIIHNNSEEILNEMIKKENDPFELRPVAPTFYLDKDYILASMGLLSFVDNDLALEIMKKRLYVIGEK